jgi:hypothetical protein
MKKENVKIGMLVRVNPNKESQIYRVDEIDGFQVKLSYQCESGDVYAGGWIDCDFLIAAKVIAAPNGRCEVRREKSVDDMTKREIAIYIADTLFGKHLSGDPSVGPNNWKVRDLVKMRKSPDLVDLYKMAERVRRGTANATILD